MLISYAWEMFLFLSSHFITTDITIFSSLPAHSRHIQQRYSLRAENNIRWEKKKEIFTSKFTTALQHQHARVQLIVSIFFPIVFRHNYKCSRTPTGALVRYIHMECGFPTHPKHFITGFPAHRMVGLDWTCCLWSISSWKALSLSLTFFYSSEPPKGKKPDKCCSKRPNIWSISVDTLILKGFKS